ncbi:hypothetical protein M0D69_00515 [Caballeronia sp. SEWSISQ10-4 2]|uniref:hypothetical protein n=1 Tax=Caballeronia sp. SEWSISQ10-4 2 TaxID=2937438 RepID=UPI0026532FCD|nr:hypothetical protein [Caballeronia sp. SEWSISQ10-4 2]MDN7176529.1 hypothetical protein [Caballeronia sp. SEWSISQ10-4 2]
MNAVQKTEMKWIGCCKARPRGSRPSVDSRAVSAREYNLTPDSHLMLWRTATGIKCKKPAPI